MSILLSMDITTILLHTYNPDKQARLQAETALHIAIAGDDGILIKLLTVVGDASVALDLRKAAAIVLKNNCRYFWAGCTSGLLEGLEPKSEQEREEGKSLLLTVLLTETDKTIRNLLGETLKIISEFDFPANWSALMPRLLASLQPPQTAGEPMNLLAMYNSLLGIRKLVKRYEHKQASDRGVINAIIEQVFPVLQNIIVQIMQAEHIEAAMVMHMCMKIFYSATIQYLPTKVGQVDVNLWFSLFAFIISKNLPEANEGLEPAGQPVNIDDRLEWPWWKCKKWAARIVAHFIARYGNPKHTTSEDAPFATFFRSNTALQLLGPVMNQLAAKVNGKFVSKLVEMSCFTFLSRAVEMSPSYKAIKPHLDFILLQVIFPSIGITDQDEQNFTHDPQEFIRSVSETASFGADGEEVHVAAQMLLQTMCKNRKADCLPIVLHHVLRVVKEYDSLPPAQRDYRKKDAALAAMAVLSNVIIDPKAKVNPYKSHFEPFLMQHIVPEFTSPVPYIRFRACWAIEYLDQMEWSNTALLHEVLKGMLAGLRDAALPVQAASACALRVLVEADGAVEMVRPVLPQLIGEYFRIMAETDNDVVFHALQTMVGKFGEDIVPLAPQMTQQLIEAYFRFTNAELEDDEAAFAATAVLDTVMCIMDSIVEMKPINEEIKLAVETALMPLLQFLFSEDEDKGQWEHLEFGIMMLTFFTDYSDGISPNMMSMCGPLLLALDNYSNDELGTIVHPLINFITKDTAAFLRGVAGVDNTPLVNLLLKVVDKNIRVLFEQVEEEHRQRIAEGSENADRIAVFHARSTRENCGMACFCTALLSSLITSCRELQAIDGCIKPIIQLCLYRLDAGRCQDSVLAARLLEVVMCAIFYNPSLVLQIFNEEPAGAKLFFDSFFENFRNFDSPLQQRLVVLSLSTLLVSPFDALPAEAKSNIVPMFQQVLREIKMLQETYQDKALLDAEDGDENYDDMNDEDDDDDEDEDNDGDDGFADAVDDEDEEDDERGIHSKKGIAKALDVPDEGYGEDEDCRDAGDEEYIKYLETARSGERYIHGEPVNDELHDTAHTRAIDNIDVLLYFADAMSALAGRDPAFFANLQSAIDASDNAILQQISVTATERRSGGGGGGSGV